ncbi:MAG: type II toxin-antitoxin system VapC family toxin [Pseudomonadota bacterium]
MISVVDANVAIKWFVRQPDSPQAHAVVAAGDTLLAPDLIVPEVANALWRHLKVGEIELDRAIVAMDDLPRLLNEIVSSASLSKIALHMAEALNHAVYDCLYAALAIDRSATFITADRRFAEKLRASRRLTRIKLLDEIRVTP